MLGWHERFNRELDNLRVAAGWCVARGQAGDDAATERGLVVLADLGLYWSFLDGRYGELRTWLQRLLALQGAVSQPGARTVAATGLDAQCEVAEQVERYLATRRGAGRPPGTGR